MKVSHCQGIWISVIMYLGVCQSAHSQTQAYPPFWWSGMQNDTLELLLFNNEGFEQPPSVPEQIRFSSRLAANPQYAYVKLFLRDMQPGKFKIGKGKKGLVYELKPRGNYIPKGLNPEDAIYLISPDRFANGNPSNDHPAGFKEKKYDRSEPFGRHGGDIQGIVEHLDYIKDLGFNSIWVCPLVTNDQTEESYHGYAITDHYHIDPRFGSNAEYATLVETMHRQHLKMVMDVVYNHLGTEHPLFRNLPDSTFFNWHKDSPKGYLQTNYRTATLMDPHASQADKSQFSNGWFVSHMPDINQRNPHMAAFLIQNSIWWIEEFGVDAFRLDTYTYPDQKFMGRLASRIKKEYPDFFIFGETWVQSPVIQSYFLEGNRYNPVSTNLDAVTDFTLCFALQEALTKKPEWNEGIAKVYYRLAADYLYEHPELLVTFLDNHDLARIFGYLGEDLQKLKTAMGMLLTLRGIPCVYYGTEILMKQTANHGVIRQDFPGGWATDSVSKFSPAGRTAAENEIFDFMQKLLQYRKTSEALTEGKLTQFVPQDGVYVYFRYSENEKIMVLVNANETEVRTVSLSRFSELWPKGSTGINILSQEAFSGNEISLAPKSIQIIQMD